MIPDSPYPPGVSGSDINKAFGEPRCRCGRELNDDYLCEQCDGIQEEEPDETR